MSTCQCIKANGDKCTYKAKPNSKYCGIHKNCKKTGSSKISAKSMWIELDKGLKIGGKTIQGHYMRTIDEAKLDVYGCVRNLGPVMEFLCTK